MRETQNIDETAIQQQLDRLSEMKKNRDDDTFIKSIASLKEAATGNENLIPYIIHSVKAHATLGEISDALRSVFGEY